jgi:hypothetical protein
MRTAIFVLTMTLAGLPLSSPADTIIYRCVGAHGLIYQDVPCAGARETQNRVIVTGEFASSRPAAAPRQDRSLSEWIARTERENRQREAERRVKALQQQTQAEEAEFAVMMEDLEQKQQAAQAGVADVPPIYQLEATKVQVKQEYAERLQQNRAELRDAQAALAEEQSR